MLTCFTSVPDAVIGWAGPSPSVELYHLADKDAGIVGDNVQRDALSNSSAVVEDGFLRVSFTRQLQLTHAGSVDVRPFDQMNMLWAVGPGNQLAYHGALRDTYTLRLATAEAPPSPPSQPPDAPSPPPVPLSPPASYPQSSEPGFVFAYEPPGTPEGFTLHWVPPVFRRRSRRLEDTSFTILVTLPDPGGFLGLGFSRDGNMVGSDAVISHADSTSSNVAMHHLADQTVMAVADNELPGVLTNASATLEDGILRVTFTRPLTLSHENNVPIAESAFMIWAIGPSSELAYHGGANRGRYEISFQGGINPPPPSPAPLPPAPPLAPPSGFPPSTEFANGFQFEPPGAPDGYVLHWELVPAAASSRSRRGLQEGSVKMLVVAPDPGGYVAVGFSTDGAMVGSDAVIGWASASSSHVEMYHLAGRSVAGVGDNLIPDVLTDASAVLQDGNLRVSFTRPLALPRVGSVALTSDQSSVMLWAVGPGMELAHHGAANKGSFGIQLDGGGGGVVTLGLTELQKNKRLHAILMIISWGFLLPAGAVIAKFFKHKDPLWFHAHRVIQVIGLVLALTGWIIALIKLDPLGGDEAEGNVVAHGTIGIIVMAIGIFQPCNAFIRPHKGDQFRFVWECCHKGSGWLAIILAIVVISLGIDIIATQEVVAFPDARTHFWAAYGACFGLLACVGAAGCLTGRNAKQRDPSGPSSTKGQAGVPSEPASTYSAIPNISSDATKRGSKDKESGEQSTISSSI